MSDLMMITVDFSGIPQSNPVYLHVPHVCAIELCDPHATLSYLASEIVLWPLLHVPELVPAMKPILLIVEFDPPRQLMLHRAHHQVIELVSLVVIDDLRAVWELHCFLPIDVESGRVEPGLGSKGVPAVRPIELIRSLNEEARDRRVVLCLFQKDSRTVRGLGLEGLS